MNNVKKLAVTLAMFGMGVFGLANNINTPVNNVNQVQAAAKPKKIKGVHYYKKVHVVTLFGDYSYNSLKDVKKNKLTSGGVIDSGLYGTVSVDGYTYVNGKKYLHDNAGSGSYGFVAASALTKRPKYYTVNSKIQVYSTISQEKQDKDMSLIMDSDGFSYEGGAYAIEPNKGKQSVIAVMTDKVYKSNGEKYYAAVDAMSGNRASTGFINIRDMKKLAKGASPVGTGFSSSRLKADEQYWLNYNRKHGGAWNTWANRHAVIGGISAK